MKILNNNVLEKNHFIFDGKNEKPTIDTLKQYITNHKADIHNPYQELLPLFMVKIPEFNAALEDKGYNPYNANNEMSNGNTNMNNGNNEMSNGSNNNINNGNDNNSEEGTPAAEQAEALAEFKNMNINNIEFTGKFPDTVAEGANQAEEAIQTANQGKKPNLKRILAVPQNVIQKRPHNNNNNTKQPPQKKRRTLKKTPPNTPQNTQPPLFNTP